MGETEHNTGKESIKPDDQALCIGDDGDNGCGYEGGESGGNCPKCGGMLLSRRCIRIADKVTEEWIKRAYRNDT